MSVTSYKPRSKKDLIPAGRGWKRICRGGFPRPVSAQCEMCAESRAVSRNSWAMSEMYCVEQILLNRNMN